MAVNETVSEHFCSAEYEIKNIINVINKDKRGDKKWSEKVLQSVNIIRTTFVFLKGEFLQCSREDPLHVATATNTGLYSHAVRPKTNISKNVVIVSPKNPAVIRDSEQTLQIVRSSTCNKIKVGVNHVKKVKDKSIVVELRNEVDCKEFIQTIEANSSELKAVIAKKYNPRTIVHGIEAMFPEEELVESIIEQNSNIKQCMLDPTQCIKKIFMKRSRDGMSQFAVLEVTPMIYHAVKAGEKLYIGYSRCTVHDRITVMRCYKCFGYRHIAKNCENTQCCPQCADSHDISDCPQHKLQCVNCMLYNDRMKNRPHFKPNDTAHSATSTNCPAYQKIIEIIKTKINYG